MNSLSYETRLFILLMSIYPAILIVLLVYDAIKGRFQPKKRFLWGIYLIVNIIMLVGG